MFTTILEFLGTVYEEEPQGLAANSLIYFNEIDRYQLKPDTHDFSINFVIATLHLI